MYLSWKPDYIEDRQGNLRKPTFEEVREKIPSASDDLCEKIYQVKKRLNAKFIYLRQALLQGEIDAANYQSQFHSFFVEQQIELEQLLGYDDFNEYLGLPPGNDMFMVLTNWGMDLPKGFKLGLEEPPPSVWGAPEETSPGNSPPNSTDEGR